MKQRLMLCVLLLALALGIPVAVAAQDTQGVWEFTETLTFTDLGFNVSYPTGWTYGATESSGVFFAENKTDLTDVTDADPNTLAKGHTFQIIGTPVDALAKLLETDDPTLEQLGDFLVESRGITEKEARVEVPVMSRRSLAIIGEDAAGQGWILTVWKQNGFAIGAFLTSATYDETINISFSWGQFLANIKPNDPLPLGKDTMALTKVAAEFNYPEDWTPNPDNGNIVYELEGDLKNNTSDGFLLVGIEQTLADLKLADDATLEDVVEANIASLALTEPVRREEFLILGQPAITIRGTDGSGQFALLTQTIIDGVVLQIGAIAPTEAAMDTFESTFIAMLQTLHSTKAT